MTEKGARAVALTSESRSSSSKPPTTYRSPCRVSASTRPRYHTSVRNGSSNSGRVRAVMAVTSFIVEAGRDRRSA